MFMKPHLNSNAMQSTESQLIFEKHVTGSDAGFLFGLVFDPEDAGDMFL
jgi:hypothetical protein